MSDITPSDIPVPDADRALDDDPIRVVVVDDVEAHRLLASLAIDATDGMRVVGEASDGVQACEQVEQLQPDAIILDLRMPVLDGFEAIPLLRTLAPHVRIVVWTGTADPEDLARARALGAHAVVRKLAESREVADAVRSTVLSYRRAATSALASTISRGALLRHPEDVRLMRPWRRYLRQHPAQRSDADLPTAPGSAPPTGP